MTISEPPGTTASLLATVSVLAAPNLGPYVAVIAVGVAVVLLVIILGRVYPAVWSRKPSRRKSALAVIRLLLRFLRVTSVPCRAMSSGHEAWLAGGVRNDTDTSGVTVMQQSSLKATALGVADSVDQYLASGRVLYGWCS